LPGWCGWLSRERNRGAMMGDQFQEFEEDFGLPRAQWNLKQWEYVAHQLAGTVDACIDRLVSTEIELKKVQKYLSTIYEMYTELSKRKPAGRPRKQPIYPNRLMALAAGAEYKPKSQPGRPAKYTMKDCRYFIDLVEQTKQEQGLKSDKGTITYMIRSHPSKFPPSSRRKSIEFYCKLLSGFRKSVEKIQE